MIAARRSLPVLALAGALLAGPAPVCAAEDNADIAVHVEKDGGTIRVRVDCPVRAPAAIAWDVLTDYDNMAKFVSNLTQSSVRMRMGDRVQVFQKGKASRGPLSIAFENVREIELVPRTEIRSRIVSGDTMPAEFVTRIEERGGEVHVVHTGHYTPSMWVPPGIGPALIEAETRKQYGEIRAEIVRRAGAKGGRAGGG
ncbi:MAG: SRPBCC family protein [Burkholderiales bacterium]